MSDPRRKTKAELLEVLRHSELDLDTATRKIGELRIRIEELEQTLSDLDNAIANLPCWTAGDSFQTLKDATVLLWTWKRWNEKLTAIIERTEQKKDKPRYMYLHGDLADKIGTIVGSYASEQRAAIETLGAFQEHVLISLQAMLMIVKQTYSMTHRQKDARLDMLCDTIQETINNIHGAKNRDWRHFDQAPFSVKNWDVRQLAATKFRLERDTKKFEHLVELVTEYNPELLKQWQAGKKKPQRDKIPF